MEKPTGSKYCIVPKCKSSSINTPDKIFVTLPGGTSKTALKRRALWLQAMRRKKDDISKNTTAFVCEDHFNFKEDMENYVKYRIMGGKVFLKNNVVPHKFECQKDRKRPGSMIERPYSVERARKKLVATLLGTSLDSCYASQTDSTKAVENHAEGPKNDILLDESLSTAKPSECLLVSEAASCEGVRSHCKYTQTEWADAKVYRTVSTQFRSPYRSKFVQTDVSKVTTMTANVACSPFKTSLVNHPPSLSRSSRNPKN